MLCVCAFFVCMCVCLCLCLSAVWVVSSKVVFPFSSSFTCMLLKHGYFNRRPAQSNHIGSFDDVADAVAGSTMAQRCNRVAAISRLRKAEADAETLRSVGLVLPNTFVWRVIKFLVFCLCVYVLMCAHSVMYY